MAPADWPAISYDAFVTLDLPAVMAHIADVTGTGQLHWLGHSMGGMLAYSTLGTPDAARLRSLITVGTPVGFPQGWAVTPHLRPLRALGTYIPGIQVAFLLKVAAPLVARTRLQPGLKTILELDNVDPAYVRRLAFRAVQDIPRGLLLQFRDWIHHDAFRSADKTVDYRARMVGAQCPTLVVSGPLDQLGHADAVERAVHLLGNATALHCAKDSGFSADYGHIDLIFGKAAPEEIFPRFIDFFAAHDEKIRSRSNLTLVNARQGGARG